MLDVLAFVKRHEQARATDQTSDYPIRRKSAILMMMAQEGDRLSPHQGVDEDQKRMMIVARTMMTMMKDCCVVPILMAYA